MAKQIMGPIVGRRLVEEGILTQEQLMNTERVSLEVSGSDVPRLVVHMFIENAALLRLLGEPSDG